MHMGCGVLTDGATSFTPRFSSLFRHAGLEPASRATKTNLMRKASHLLTVFSGCPGPRLKAEVTEERVVLRARSTA